MRETQILRGLHKARAANHFADGMVPRGPSPLLSLRRGAVSLRGPGTTTSDSIPAHLSKGESVLPAKTTAALGPENIASAIKVTTGKAPARGLRAGGRHASGVIPGMDVPTLDEARARVQAQPKPPIGNTFSASPTPGAMPVAETPKPSGLWNQAKYYGGKAAGALGDAAEGVKSAPAGGLKALGRLSLAAAPAMGAAGAVMDSDTNVKNLAASTGLDYGTDAGRAGANVVNFLDKTGNAATFGLAGKLGRAVSNKVNGGSFFDTTTPATTTPQPAATQPNAAAPARNDPYAAANAAKIAAANAAPQTPSINVQRQPNGVTSFSNTADAGQNTYTGPGAAGLRRGNMNVMPALNGGDNAGAPSDADLATMRANLRDGVDLQRGTSQGRAQANDPQSLLMNQIQGGLSRGQSLTAAGVAALQGLNNTDKNYRASMYGSEVSRANSREGHQVESRGQDLSYQGSQNRLGLDRAKLSYDIGQTAAKGVNDDNMNSPFATMPDDKGVPQVNQAKANELGQFLRASAGNMTTPDGKPVSLEQLRASNPGEYQRVRTAAETQFGLGQLVNKYARGTTFGAETGWGAPQISGIREMGPSDWLKGSKITDAVLAGAKPGYYSQGVEVDLGGRKQIVPMGEFLSDQNGGQYRGLLNQWLAAHGKGQLGNMATGE